MFSVTIDKQGGRSEGPARKGKNEAIGEMREPSKAGRKQHNTCEKIGNSTHGFAPTDPPPDPAPWRNTFIKSQEAIETVVALVVG